MQGLWAEQKLNFLKWVISNVPSTTKSSDQDSL